MKDEVLKAITGYYKSIQAHDIKNVKYREWSQKDTCEKFLNMTVYEVIEEAILIETYTRGLWEIHDKKTIDIINKNL